MGVGKDSIHQRSRVQQLLLPQFQNQVVKYCVFWLGLILLIQPARQIGALLQTRLHQNHLCPEGIVEILVVNYVAILNCLIVSKLIERGGKRTACKYFLQL